MHWRELFNRPRKPPAFDPGMNPGAAAPTSDPVFLTVQSILTFSGANVGITAVRGMVSDVFPETAHKAWFAVSLCIVVAIAIWAIGVTDPQAKMTRREKTIGFGIAILNSAMLYLGSEGLLSKFKP